MDVQRVSAAEKDSHNRKNDHDQTNSVENAAHVVLPLTKVNRRAILRNTQKTQDNDHDHNKAHEINDIAHWKSLFVFTGDTTWQDAVRFPHPDNYLHNLLRFEHIIVTQQQQQRKHRQAHTRTDPCGRQGVTQRGLPQDHPAWH